MENTKTIEILVQGGAIGICLALIGVIVWLIKTLKEIIVNHLKHADETQEALTIAITKLTTVIEQKVK